MFKTNTIRWPAPAKLNLFLYINNQRQDGYHELQTLFQFIDICDYLTITANFSGKITLSDNIDGVPLANNLIYKAALLLKEKAPSDAGAEIKIEKNLPMGGGLGGGSSDAATTLVALNYHWNLNLTQQDLSEIGLQLGADVPIFVFGKAAIAEGVGERFTAVEPAENCYLIAIPASPVATASIFQSANLIRNTKKRTHTQLMHNIWQNDCEPCVKNYYPEVAKVIDWLIEYAPTRLTGTGSCVFSTFNNTADAQVTIDKAPEWLNAFTAQGQNRSPLSVLLSTLN